MEQKKTSVWTYLGCGCGLLVFLVLVGVVSVTYYTYRKAKGWEESLKDPQARAEKVQGILGAQVLPEGYQAAAWMSIPWFMEMAMLTDQAQPDELTPEQLEDLEFSEHAFIYINARAFGGAEKVQEAEDFFSGKTDRPGDALDKISFDTEQGSTLRHDSLDVAGMELHAMVRRGDFDLGSGGQRREDSLTNMVFVDCPQDDRIRIGIWIGPDPDPSIANEELELTGTVGDPEKVRDLFRHFALCQAG